MNESGSEPIKLNFGNEFEDIEFKPITKGLGFHKNAKKEKVTPKVNKPAPGFNTHRAASLSRESVAMPTTTPLVAKEAGPTQGLQKFYSTPSTETLKQQPELKKSAKKKKTVVYESASAGETVIAYIVDLCLISGLLGVTFYLLSRVVGIGPSEIVTLLPAKQGYIYLALLFSLFYLFYFTVLDLTASPGKSLMGIKVVTGKAKRVEMRHTFTRAIVSLVCLPLLGLPLAFDIQGKLSDSKLVK